MSHLIRLGKPGSKSVKIDDLQAAIGQPSPPNVARGVRAVVIRDSFGQLLPELLAPTFESCVFLDSARELTRDFLHEESPDVVIEEVVERFIIPRLQSREDAD